MELSGFHKKNVQVIQSKGNRSDGRWVQGVGALHSSVDGGELMARDP